MRVRRKERGGSDGVSGNDYRGARFSIDDEKRKRTKQKRRGRDGDYEDEERDTETRRNAVYALSVIGGRGERPSMWRTCCRCSLPVERAPRVTYSGADEHGALPRASEEPITITS